MLFCHFVLGSRSAAPLWDRPSNVIAQSSQAERFQRSTSSSTLNKNWSISNLRSQCLWGSSYNSPLNVSKTGSSHFKKSKDLTNGDHNSSDDDSSLSDGETYSRALRPGTPPKPSIFRQIRRSSTSHNMVNTKPSEYLKHKSRKIWDNFELRSSKSEYNLNYLGREGASMPNRSNTSTPVNFGLWGNRTSPESMMNYRFDISSSNPATVQLTTELCQHIIDELNHIATYTKKIYHRCFKMEKNSLCNLLVDGVSKAYVNLSTVVPPAPGNKDCFTMVSAAENTGSLPPESVINTMNLLQEYSNKLLSMVEQKMTKENEADKSNAANKTNGKKI